MPLGPVLYITVFEGFAYRRKQHHRGPILTTAVLYSLEASLQRLCLHHHTWTSAKRPVIDTTVVALGEVAQLPQVHTDLTAAIGSTCHARL